MLTLAFGEFTLSQKSAYNWYKRTEGRKDVDDDEHPGGATTSASEENTETVKTIVLENRQITIKEVAEDIGISIDSGHTIFLSVLGLKREAAKFVPKLLNFEHKQFALVSLRIC